MAQYINKDVLLAEIEKRKQELHPTDTHKMQAGEKIDRDVLMWLNALTWVKKVIDTLEVKEVDLEQEIQQHINDCLDIKFPTTDIKMIAKDVEYTARKFFELGLKAQKGEQNMKTGIELIADERKRQIKVEGWSAEHDSEHKKDELAMAAVSYAMPKDVREAMIMVFTSPIADAPPTWPWNVEWWKPTPDNRIKELVKAGALIAAEIDRLQRKSNI